MWKLSKIPQIAHFYWHGEMLSWLRYLTLKTFQVQNPDWELRFYYPKVQHTGQADWEEHSKERTGVEGHNYFKEVKKIPNTKCIELDFTKDFGDIPDVYRSDLLRLKLLGEDGGLWLDMDVISFKPMSEAVFNCSPNIDTVLSYSLKREHYSIGFMLASKGNEFFNFLYNKGIGNDKREKYLFDKYGDRQRYGVILWDSYFDHINNIYLNFPNLAIYNFQFKVCYPYLYNNMENILDVNAPLEDDIIALHYYGGHPAVRPWENVLSPSNYFTFDTTLCKCIKKGLKK